MSTDNGKDLRGQLARLLMCKTMLYINDMITDKERDKIHARIAKFQDKHKIEISEWQINSVELKYTDK